MFDTLPSSIFLSVGLITNFGLEVVFDSVTSKILEFLGLLESETMCRLTMFLCSCVFTPFHPLSISSLSILIIFFDFDKFMFV